MKLGSLYVCLIQYALILFFSQLFLSYIVLSLFHLLSFFAGLQVIKFILSCFRINIEILAV